MIFATKTVFIKGSDKKSTKVRHAALTIPCGSDCLMIVSIIMMSSCCNS